MFILSVSVLIGKTKTKEHRWDFQQSPVLVYKRILSTLPDEHSLLPKPFLECTDCFLEDRVAVICQPGLSHAEYLELAGDRLRQSSADSAFHEAGNLLWILARNEPRRNLGISL